MNFFQSTLRALKVAITYKKLQENHDTETSVELSDLTLLSSAWKSDEIAKKQEVVVDEQIKNYEDGYLDDVFGSLLETLDDLQLESRTILDAACASGYYSKILGDSFQYTGSDYSSSMVELAKIKFPSKDFSEADLTNLPFEDNKFEIVLVAGVLEHIPEFKVAISETCRTSSKYVIIHRCLTSGGKDNLYSTGFLYNIKTPRIYYAQDVLEAEFKKNGYELVKKVKSHVYKGIFPQIKVGIKKYILRRRGGIEYTYTFKKLT